MGFRIKGLIGFMIHILWFGFASFLMGSMLLLLISAWLQRTKRDLSSLSALRGADHGQFVRPEDVKDSLLPHAR